MKIILGADHRGKILVENLKQSLIAKGYEVAIVDKDNYDTDDYPDFAFKLCDQLLKEKYDLGVLVCRTGIGMSIAANKVKGIRCARVTTKEDVELSKIDNAVNVLSVSYELGLTEICEFIDTFFNVGNFREDRHTKRINKIIAYESQEYNEL